MAGSLPSRIQAAYTEHLSLLKRHLFCPCLFITDVQDLTDLDHLDSGDYTKTDLTSWTEDDLVKFEQLCLQELLDRFLQGLGMTDRNLVKGSMMTLLQDVFDSQILQKDIGMTQAEIDHRIRVVVQWYQEQQTQSEAYSKAKKALEEQVTRYAKQKYGKEKYGKGKHKQSSLTNTTYSDDRAGEQARQSEKHAICKRPGVAKMTKEVISNQHCPGLANLVSHNPFSILADTDTSDQETITLPKILSQGTPDRPILNTSTTDPGLPRLRSMTVPVNRALQPPAKMHKSNFGYAAPNWDLAVVMLSERCKADLIDRSSRAGGQPDNPYFTKWKGNLSSLRKRTIRRWSWIWLKVSSPTNLE